jgi:HEAT repeat protein
MVSPAISKTESELRRLRGIISRAKDWNERRRAVFALSYLDGVDCWPLISKCMDDPMDQVRYAAVIAAGRRGINEARSKILRPRILCSPDPNLRWAAVKALRKIQDRRDIIPLTRQLNDPDWLVQNEVKKALASFIKQLGEDHSSDSIDTLIHLLFLRTHELRELVIKTLCLQGSRALPALREALNEPSPAMLAGVVRCIGLLYDRQSLQALISLSSHPDRELRVQVAIGLGNLHFPEAVVALISMLNTNQKTVIKVVEQALIFQGESAVTPLMEAIEHSQNNRYKVSCVRILGQLRDRRCVPMLLNCLSSSYYLMRQATVGALSAFGKSIIDDVIPQIKMQDTDVESALERYQRESSDEGRIRAIRIIGEMGNHRAVSALKDIRIRAGKLNNMDLYRAVDKSLYRIGCFAWERYCLISVLDRVGATKHINQLIHSLKHPSYYVRNRTVRALSRINDPIAIKALCKAAVDDPRYFVRRTALQSMGSMHIEKQLQLRTTLKAINDSAAGVRIEAVRILARLMNEKALHPLVKGLEDNIWSVREACETALLNYRDSASRPVSRLLSHEKEFIRYRVSRLLGRLEDPTMLPALRKRLRYEANGSRIHSTIKSSIHKLELIAREISVK